MASKKKGTTKRKPGASKKAGANKKAVANKARLGRSFLAGEVSLDEIRTLTKAFGGAAELFDDKMMDGSIYDVVVADGDLHVKGDLRTFEHKLVGLIVRGSLEVDGLYADTDDPATGVFVHGDMKVRRMVTNGELGVRGSLTATEVLVGFYNDYSATIGKDVITPLFHPETHHFEIKGRLEAKTVVGQGAEFRVPKKLKSRVEALVPKRLRDVLVDDVLVGKGRRRDQARLRTPAHTCT